MTGARYVCCDDDRRELLSANGPPGISGIDYVEVTQGKPVTIDIHLVRPLPEGTATLTSENVIITGGVRLPAPKVDTVSVQPSSGPVSYYRVALVPGAQTDFSTYRLALVAGQGKAAPPEFIDSRLSAVDFSFKVNCPTDFDCAPVPPPPPEAGDPEAAFSYLARDWEGFRKLMLDRMAVLVPNFREDDPVDLTTTLIEALAWRADLQSYRIDWVSTEAFLETARSRTSVARHARLVDYVPEEGASSRCFVAFNFETQGAPLGDGLLLRAGTPLLPKGAAESPVIAAADYPAMLGQSPVVFELVEDLKLWKWRSEIALHTWSDGRCTLPRGATAATLVDGSEGNEGKLDVGDFLLFEQTASPVTGEAADADPARRHVVRLIQVTPATDVLAPKETRLVDVAWDATDALPFDLVISAEVAQLSGPPALVTCAVARGNVMLADHGASLPPAEHLMLQPSTIASLRPHLDPPAAPVGEAWRPVLLGGIGPLARIAQVRPTDTNRPSAAALTTVDPASCRPALTLIDSFASWSARQDLLASGQFGRQFVVEIDMGDTVRLRFGDGTHGLAPTPGAHFTVAGRFGSGPAGMIGHDALGHVVLPDALSSAAIVDVRNPVPARGGVAAESIDAIRLAAPQAFRVQDRAVTAGDYAEAACRHPAVANAVAVPRWTGAWMTMLVYVDRKGGLPMDDSFRAELLLHLEHFRLAGFDVAVRPALAVPLEIVLEVCAKPEALRAVVGQRVRRSLTPFGPEDGTPGFFHPDNFTFGSVLYLSRLTAAVMAVEGVQSVRPAAFHRYRRLPQGELQAGAVRPVGTEILELRDDPSFPESGRLEIIMGGGR